MHITMHTHTSFKTVTLHGMKKLHSYIYIHNILVDQDKNNAFYQRKRHGSGYLTKLRKSILQLPRNAC